MVQPIKQSTVSTTSKEYSKLMFSVIGSVLIGVICMGFVVFIPNALVRTILIPPMAYAVSLFMSYIFQSAVCPSTNMKAASVTNLAVFVSTGLASFVLFLESIPILSYFGYSEPISPLTGLPISKESSPEEYSRATDDNKHLKIEFFSGIVKAVLPVYHSEVNKNAVVYLYWMFWMSMLPLHIVLGLQGVC